MPTTTTHGESTHAQSTHVHFIAMLLLAALVLIVTLGVRDHKPPPQPHLDTNSR